MNVGVIILVSNQQENITASSVKIRAVVTMCVDGGITGELDCLYCDEPVAFTGLVRMIEIMEAMFDEKGFPEMQLLPRTFGTKRGKNGVKKQEVQSSQTQIEPGSEISTFDILVGFRHNAEWQGQIYWVEKNESEEFSSIIELCRFINNAFSA